MLGDSNSEETDVKGRRDAWFKYFQRWQYFSWGLLVFISGGSAAVASQIVPPVVRDGVALAVALCAALLATLQPQRRAQAYRQAWIAIDLAIKASARVAPDMLDAIRKGENIIGDSHAEKNADADHL
jgi:hypothetical protein